MSAKPRRFGAFESLETRQLMAADLAAVVELAPPPNNEVNHALVSGEVAYIVDWSPEHIAEGDHGIVSDKATPKLLEAAVKGKVYQHVAPTTSQFAFGVEREMKESGERGGTTDINIGVGELQECTISKSMDTASTAHGGGDWFIADSFSFGVEREMKESGEKGGTTDINIGVGELQECTISKSMDAASPYLSETLAGQNASAPAKVEFKQFTIQKQVDMSHVGSSALDKAFAEDGDAPSDSSPMCYLKYKLDRCFVKSWSTSGDADDRPTEEVAFYYNKI